MEKRTPSATVVEAGDLLARRMAGQATEEEVAVYRQRFIHEMGGFALRFWVGVVVVIAVLYSIFLGSTRLLAIADKWQPLVEVVVNVFLGLSAIYLGVKANGISHQQTELARRQTDVADRQQRLAEEQLRPRLRVRVKVVPHGGETGDVSSYLIENLGGEVTGVSVMTASALQVSLRKAADSQAESFTLPVNFFTKPRYTQEVKGVVYENQALSYSSRDSRWVSNTSTLLRVGEVLNQKLMARGGWCQLSLRHFVWVEANGAFSGADKAVFEVPLFESQFMAGGGARLPYDEGGEVVSAINRNYGVGWSVVDAAEYISAVRIEGGELNEVATLNRGIAEIGKALEALEHRQERDLVEAATEIPK